MRRNLLSLVPLLPCFQARIWRTLALSALGFARRLFFSARLILASPDYSRGIISAVTSQLLNVSTIQVGDHFDRGGLKFPHLGEVHDASEFFLRLRSESEGAGRPVRATTGRRRWDCVLAVQEVEFLRDAV